MDVPAIEAVLREKLPQCELELVAEGRKRYRAGDDVSTLSRLTQYIGARLCLLAHTAGGVVDRR